MTGAVIGDAVDATHLAGRRSAQRPQGPQGGGGGGGGAASVAVHTVRTQVLVQDAELAFRTLDPVARALAETVISDLQTGGVTATGPLAQPTHGAVGAAVGAAHGAPVHAARRLLLLPFGAAVGRTHAPRLALPDHASLALPALHSCTAFLARRAGHTAPKHSPEE